MFKNIIPAFFLTMGLVGAYGGLVSTVQAAAPAGSNQVAEIGVSTGTNFVTIMSGTGFFYDIIKSSGTIGEYTVCFDSASITGLTLFSDGTSSAPRLPAAYIVQVATSGVNGANTRNDYPIGLANGLSCGNSAANHTSVIYRPE